MIRVEKLSRFADLKSQKTFAAKMTKKRAKRESFCPSGKNEKEISYGY